MLNLVAQLGPSAFQGMNWWAANTMLLAMSAIKPTSDSQLVGINVSAPRTQEEKAKSLRINPTIAMRQDTQLSNPDARIIFGHFTGVSLLRDYADSRYGLRTADAPKFIRCFWELHPLTAAWRFHQSTVDETVAFGGREHCLLWDNGRGELKEYADLGLASLQGEDAWGKLGVVVSLMGKLPVTRYTGEFFDNNCAALWPKDISHLPAIWAFCASSEFSEEVRKLDHAIKVTNLTLLKVPFNLSRWEELAVEQHPEGLPKLSSNYPTQWLFNGEIACSTYPLQVSVARMLGYRWPEQPKEDDAIDALTDRDGIVCIPAVRGERPAAERLIDILRTAYGSQWSDAILHKLLTDAGCKPGTSLDEWLRDKFFEQSCRRFQHRPFIWHIWDGRKDGFSCLVNYHKLTHQRLETLTYAYLQDWITAQTAAARDSKPGADLRLATAQELQNKLKLILDGEPPYDIFVRWKPIREQPIGWNPDLNEGVRVNIRPFVVANVLRKPPNIKWTKDRGKEPERDPEQFPWFWKNGASTSDRINDAHLTNAQKRAAREKASHGSVGS
jgi:hypothetical protein